MKNLKSYDEFLNERARPPKLKAKERKANAVKGQATRKLLGPGGELEGVKNKIFKKVEMEIKKVAKKDKVNVSKVNVDSITLKKAK